MKKATRLALINGAIAGALVIAGTIASGNITWQGFCTAFGAALVVFLTKLRDYFGKIDSKKAMKGGLFEFI